MKRIIIFGVGKRLDFLMEKGYLSGTEIAALCDNDVSKQGLLIHGIKVIAPPEIKEYKFDGIYVSSEKYYDDIRRQLISEVGIDSDLIQFIKAGKYDSEIAYWKERFQEGGGKFENAHYKKLMLDIAQETDDTFLKGMIVADFGCGPRGSLTWTNKPIIKLGIDVLARDYLENFGEELIKQNMIYVTSSEDRIPVPNEFVDYLFTINSLDHVDHLEQISKELLRILKKGGTLLASFNLNEPKTECEPQTLTEEIIQDKILQYFEIDSYRVACKNKEGTYLNMWNNDLVDSLKDNEMGVLWVRGRKK